jgi:hypothetical protein
MKHISAVVVLIGGLIAGYFAYPVIHSEPKTTIPDYEQLVKNISKAIPPMAEEQHDQMLMHEVFERNENFNAQYEKQKQELEIQKDIRETALMKAALENLKTPEARQALLNLMKPVSE